MLVILVSENGEVIYWLFKVEQFNAFSWSPGTAKMICHVWLPACLDFVSSTSTGSSWVKGSPLDIWYYLAGSLYLLITAF